MVAPNPYAPPAADPGELARRGESALRVQLVLQIVLAVLHGLLVLSTLLNVAMLLAGFDLSIVGRPGSSSYEQGRQVGRAIAFVMSFVWGIGGAAWCIINAIGISSRKPWAYASLRAYWIAAIASCCCSPFGIFGLIHLNKPEVKLALGKY